MVLELDVFRFRRAVGKSHVLQFAFAASVANRAIERMVAEQQLHHAFARLLDLVAVGRHDHAFGDYRRAGGLQLRHLLHPHQAHAARALQRQVRVITERGDFDADVLAGFDQQSARGAVTFLPSTVMFTSLRLHQVQ